MSSASRRSFGRLAPRYDELRPVDENWWGLFDLLVREADLSGRRVLEVGCGTGTLAAALAERARCRVWAVDAERRMLEVARSRVPRGVGLNLGSAEELPFKDGFFERVVTRLLVHLVDRPRAFAEASRVLGSGGVLAVATFDPASFFDSWLHPFFPSIAAIDSVRFPAPEALSSELDDSGFTTRLVRLDQAVSFDRAEALEKLRGKHIGTFDLIDAAEYEAGLEQAERELPDRVNATLHWVIAVAVAR